MTVSYTSEVANNKGFGSFWKLLFRWRGSVYKLVWKDMVVYSLLYYGLSLVYRLALSEDSKRTFEKVCLHMQHFTELIPLSFVLGFYINIVFKRWWTQYISLPHPTSLSVFLSTFIVGHDDKGRKMRRTVIRYANLAATMTYTMISPPVKKRFPSMDHLVEAGLLTANEMNILKYTSTHSKYSIHYMPLVWAGTLITKARKEGRIRDDFAVVTLLDELNKIQTRCRTLLNYDWISIPLVYTQVITLAVYTFFLSSLMARQFLDPKQNYENNNVDLYIPIFTYLQFFFYMGWLKVAETLVNPFGEDDDDFELNYIIDKNMRYSYLIVDDMHNEHPELVQDIFWDQVFVKDLPYTIASEQFRSKVPLGSTAKMEIPLEKQEIVTVAKEEVIDEVPAPENIDRVEVLSEHIKESPRTPEISHTKICLNPCPSLCSGLVTKFRNKSCSSSGNNYSRCSSSTGSHSKSVIKSNKHFSLSSLKSGSSSNQVSPDNQIGQSYLSINNLPVQQDNSRKESEFSLHSEEIVRKKAKYWLVH